ncbi:MAG TPA: PAS domain S-box protein [Steroidobacteraceae bacterium]
MQDTAALRAAVPESVLAFLAGGGELGALIRAFDWAATPLGPPERWPQSLKTATAILLRSPVPIVLLWGPQGTMIYNDAYAVFGGGRHPYLLGSPVLEGWPEVSDFNAHVMQVGLSGGTLAYRNQHLVLYRSGKAEDVWMNLDYSPVLDESGRPGGVLAIVVETTERVIGERRLREHERRLLESEARYRSLFEHAAVGIEQLALDGSLLGVNDALCRMLGYRREELLGRSFVELTHPEDRDREAFLLGRLLASEVRSYSIEKRYLRSDGAALWVRVTSSLAVADERPLHRISVIEDITARKQSEEALAEADRRKDEFLAMLAHELRNPLAPIGNASAVLSHMLTGDSRAQLAVGMIKRQTTQLTRLVDDLLDVSRVTQGRIQLRRKPVDLASVIAQAVETVGPQLREKRHRVSITMRYEPLYVDADFARLVQCLGNILANAAKYTDPGGEIQVRSLAEESSAVIEVADTGAGISPELLPRIFDLFVQSDRTLDRAQGGLGIGLAVVKRLIEMHGGEVAAYSAGLGHGSTFEVRLPRIAQPEEPSSEPSRVKTPTRRVLIVDDNQDAANSLAMLLACEGHETAAVYSGSEALERVRAFQPDVALLDIGLPVMDGYELARRLRAMPESRGVRLVALTGYGQTEDHQRTREAGFDDHLVKPVDVPALERTLAGLRGATPGSGSEST